VSVAVVGDFKADAMQRSLEKVLGRLPKRGADGGGKVPEAPRTARRVIVVDRPGAAQSNVAIGWAGPSASDADVVRLQVLSAATAGDLSTRLNLHVRKELGASYGVHMSTNALRDAGTVSIGAAIDTARTVDALRGLLGELERLRKEPLSDAELSAAKLRSYYDLEQGTVRGLARVLAQAIAVGLPAEHVSTHNTRVDAVTAEEIRAAAERRLGADGMHIVVVGDAARIADGLRGLGAGEVVVRR
jgi:zinc protease